MMCRRWTDRRAEGQQPGSVVGARKREAPKVFTIIRDVTTRHRQRCAPRGCGKDGSVPAHLWPLPPWPLLLSAVLLLPLRALALLTLVLPRDRCPLLVSHLAKSSSPRALYKRAMPLLSIKC